MRARELVKAKKRGEALELVRSLAQTGEVNADVWRMLADLTPEMDERLPALEKLLALTPGDAQARQEFERLQAFQKQSAGFGGDVRRAGKYREGD